ncbi:MAG: hypothetical protein ACJ8FP_02270 [Xanthobacteraceae bacterium]
MEEFSTSILNFSALQPQQRIRAAASRTQLAIVLLYPHSVRATAQRYGISRYHDTTNALRLVLRIALAYLSQPQP